MSTEGHERRRGHKRRSTDLTPIGTPTPKREGAITQALRVQLSGAIVRFPWLQRPWPYQLAIVLTVAAVFGRTIYFDFVNFYDDLNVLQNPLLNPPTLSSLLDFWRGPYEQLYVPLFYSSLWLDQLLGGGRPFLFHFTNIILHICSALFVMGILRRIAESFAFLEALPVPHQEYRKLAAATVGALVFACHPAQAEAVCWVTGRQDVLAGCLSLAAIYAYLIAAGPPVDLHGVSLQKNFQVRGRSYGMGLICFIFAMTTKPACMMLPFSVLAINTLLLRRPMRKSLFSLLPWFALAAFWLVISLVSHRVPPSISSMSPMATRPLLAADTLVFYVRLMLWPRNLVPIYDRSVATATTGLHCWGDLLFVLFGIALAIYAARRGYRVLPSIIILFLVPLIPVTGLVAFRYEAIATVANRYLYVALLSLAVIYAWMWLAASTHPIPRARRSLAGGLVLVAIGHALSQTPAQVRSWRNSQTLWHHELQFAPDVQLARQKQQELSLPARE